MRYMSLDLETTGLDPERCQVLEIGAVFEDTNLNPLPPVEELPYFRRVLYWEELTGSPIALIMNQRLIDLISIEGPHANSNIREPEDAWYELNNFFDGCFGFDEFHERKQWVVAGKNIQGFDLKFLPKEIQENIYYRAIDPGSRFIDWSKDKPPGMHDLLGKSQNEMSHNALEDARDVIRVLRRDYT